MIKGKIILEIQNYPEEPIIECKRIQEFVMEIHYELLLEYSKYM
jgi:hypothetical protein